MYKFAILLLGLSFFCGTSALFASDGSSSQGVSPSEDGKESNSRTVKAPTKIDILMDAVKQDSGIYNCGSYSLTNAVCFFQQQPFTGGTEYQAILSQMKAKINAAINAGLLRSEVDGLAQLKNKPIVVLGRQSFAMIDQGLGAVDEDKGFADALKKLDALALKFKENGQPVGVLMQIDDGQYAHWVFIGITKSAEGIKVVIPESAHKDYVTSHLEFLRENIISRFE